MLVRDFMKPYPTTVRPDSDPMAAQTILRYGKFRRLPVVDKNNKLVGIVTSSDLFLFFSTVPSPGVVKRQYRVDQMMTTQVITVSLDYPLEEAAKLMLKHKIGGLPVMEEEKLVGMITTSDILDKLIEALGGDNLSLRVTVRLPNRPGQFARVAAKIAALNCNICSVLSAQVEGQTNVTMRLQSAKCKDVLQAIEELEEIKVVHVWENPSPA